MTRTLAVAAAAAVLIGSGLMHGLRSNPWWPSRDLQRAAARLRDVPMELGDWTGRDLELDPREVQVAEFAGYVNRVYVNGKTGRSVGLLVACGRPGPISVHLPEYCFVGAG